MIRRAPISTLFPYTSLFRSTGGFWENRPSQYMLLPIRTVRKIGGIGVDARTASTEIPISRSPLKTQEEAPAEAARDRKSTRLNSRHANISHAVLCLDTKNLN